MNPSKEVQLKASNLVKKFANGTEALRGINTEIISGDFISIIGPSGSGKSTLLRSLNGLVRPTGGTIIFEGKNISILGEPDLRLIRKQIAMVFQSFQLIPRHSVLDNVLVGNLYNLGILDTILERHSSAATEEALKIIRLLGLQGLEHQRADQLSGGQQQRVAIGRSLMQAPKILLADEPVSSLDPSSAHVILKHLQRINLELGITVIVNLHQVELVKEYSRRVIALREGKIEFDGPTKELDKAWIQRIYHQE